MADLAKRETPLRALPQTTFRRETTLPRAPTDRPSREVNADIRRPNTANSAEALAKLLGVAEDVTSNIVGDIKAKQDTKDAAQAAFDFSAGSQDAEKFQKSRAYYQAWQLEGAKAKSLDIAQQAADKVQEVLSNPDATEQDANAAIESVFHANTHDAKGNLLDFGTPEAKLTLGHAMAETKSKLVPAVHKLIRDRQNQRLMATTLDTMFVERERGAPIGDPKAAQAGGIAPLVDPLAPLPETATHAPTHILGKLSEPFKGFNTVALTGVLGDNRGNHKHNGEDFPVPTGTPIEAPMGGEVIASFANDLGGNQVRVKLANGAIVGFAHLSERHVKVGDKVSAGELLGLSGATGHATGPHVHMTVEVNGKKVSPRHYFASHQGELVVATGAEPELKSPTLATSAPSPAAQRPGLDVEAFLSRMPPSIEKGEAKTWFIQGAIAKAYQLQDPSLLNGLENSKRPDGTPSFNPEEQLLIEKTRDNIRDHVESETEKAKRKLQSDNLDLVLDAYNHGNPPSDSWLAAQASKGLIDPQQAHTLISHNRAMQRQAEAEARAEARADRTEAMAGVTSTVNSLAAAMVAGVPSALATSDDDLRQQFMAGEFGPVGTKGAMANYRLLLTAKKQGIDRVEQSPDFAKYGALLELYKPVRIKPGGNPLMGPLPSMNTGPRLNDADYTAMVSYYREMVEQGKSPGEAYRTAVDKYARNAQGESLEMQQAVNRLSYLKCKRAGLCK